MRCFVVSLLSVAIACPLLSQQQADSNHVSPGAQAVQTSLDSDADKLGAGDVVAVSVYDSPDLSRTVHVGVDGTIRLPMVRQHILAAGLNPDELEQSIAAALVDEHLMVSPIVSVSVTESHSRPITIIGAVRNPTTFEVSGSLTLLEAIVKAGGLTDSAGSVIEITRPSIGGGTSADLTERIPVSSLMDLSNPASNIILVGGEIIRVLETGRIFIVGNVQHPGPVQFASASDSTVLKAVVLSGGLSSFTSRTAYIYRTEASGRSDQIPVEIKKIMTLKSPDVALQGNDMLYIPNAMGQKISAKALEITLGMGLGVAAFVIYLTH